MSKNKSTSALLCVIGLLVTGLLDYSFGYRISLLVFYILPIGFATLYVGPRFAIVLAILGLIIWKEQDILAGAPNLGTAAQIWNGAIVLSLFIIVVSLLHALNETLLGLESAVAERTRDLRKKTQDLQKEMNERCRLEREIHDLPERERRRFGQELHDLVCRELAGIAIAEYQLTRQLLAKGMVEGEQSQEIAAMVDRALAKSRRLARGFFTADFDASGLADALRETARLAEKRGSLRCEVKLDDTISIADEEVVIHFFRIAQEAIQNAVNHAAASWIRVSIEREESQIRLTIADDGKGLVRSEATGRGLGLRIMAYRASMINGTLKIETPPQGGTCVTCMIPTQRTRDAQPPISSQSFWF